MTELKCGVMTCIHNNDNYCALDSIEVLGGNATIAAQTSCGSFSERKGDRYTNKCEKVSLHSDICCHANSCRFNCSEKCCAGEIHVTGADACAVEETECATFRKH